MALGAAAGLTSITDDGGNTWTFSSSSGVNQIPPVAVQAGQASFCAYVLNAAPATTVTYADAQMNFTSVIVAEWSGVGSFDTSAAVSANPIGGTLAASATMTLAQTGELVLLCSNESNTWGAGPAALTAFPAGYSPYVGYALNQGSGSTTYTWSAASGAGDLATIAVAAFLPPASGPPSGTVQPATAVAAPRRKLARAVVRFTPVVTVNAHGPSGTVQPLTARAAPRRRPARAVVRFTPVTTTNGPAKPIPSRGTPPSDEAREWKRWLLWG